MLDLKHKRLDTWKLSIQLVKEIYKETEKFPKAEMYGITGQLRRAAVSIPSNIAEGSSRKSGIERKRFYEIARSSLIEVDTQLEIASELDYLSEDKDSIFSETLNHLFAKLTNLALRT